MLKATRLGKVRGFIAGLYGPDLHAKRVAALAVAMIGQAPARGLLTRAACSMS